MRGSFKGGFDVFGLTQLPRWGYVVVLLALTQIAIVSVFIYRLEVKAPWSLASSAGKQQLIAFAKIPLQKPQSVFG